MQGFKNWLTENALPRPRPSILPRRVTAHQEEEDDAPVVRKQPVENVPDYKRVGKILLMDRPDLTSRRAVRGIFLSNGEVVIGDTAVHADLPKYDTEKNWAIHAHFDFGDKFLTVENFTSLRRQTDRYANMSTDIVRYLKPGLQNLIKEKLVDSSWRVGTAAGLKFSVKDILGGNASIESDDLHKQQLEKGKAIVQNYERARIRSLYKNKDTDPMSWFYRYGEWLEAQTP